MANLSAIKLPDGVTYNVVDKTSGYITSAPVTSVNGKTGAVSLTYTDVDAASSGHTHKYAGSSSAGGAATSLAGFTNTTTSGTAIDSATQNGHVYVTGTSTGTNNIYAQSDGAAFVQAYSTSWVAQIYQDYRTGQIALRGKNNGTWQAWRKVLDSSNWTNYIAIPTSAASKVTGITASTTATKTTLGTAFTIPNVTAAGSASTWAFEEVSIPNVTAAGSASTWAFEDISCDDITSWSAGSGSASLSGAVDSSDSTQLNITLSHTHTAPSLGYTARTVSSKKSGANGSAPTLGTAIKVQSKKSGANGSAPTLGTAFTVPNVTGNTSATVSITDNGHTHSLT